MLKNIPFLVVLIAILSSSFLNAQTKDSNFVFKSPRPLIVSQSSSGEVKYSAGGSLLFTESGFGGGIFYDMKLNPTIKLEFNVSLTYIRASDEFTQWDSARKEYRVLGKINRLYRIPITAGIRYELFGNILSENFKPFLTAGGGLGLILQTPYEYSFFQSFNYLTTHIKPAVYVGAGADFSGNSKRISRVFVKYYYIPFGGDGIESVIGLPIKNCGGLFLGIDFGGGWK